MPIIIVRVLQIREAREAVPIIKYRAKPLASEFSNSLDVFSREIASVRVTNSLGSVTRRRHRFCHINDAISSMIASIPKSQA